MINKILWIKTLKKVNWNELILLYFGFFLIQISGKMTPQWLEFQSLSRPIYLTISIVTILIGTFLMFKPIILIMFGKIK